MLNTYCSAGYEERNISFLKEQFSKNACLKRETQTHRNRMTLKGAEYLRFEEYCRYFKEALKIPLG
jgi:hypothetical protein